MTKTEIRSLWDDAAKYNQQTITVCGWVRTLRHSGAIAFVELTDGSCFKGLQIVAAEDELSNFSELVRQNVGAAIIATGKILLTPQAKQPFELRCEKMQVEGTSTPDYPLQKKRHTLEFLRSMEHLRPRTNTLSAVFRVRSVAAYAVHSFFNERGFVYSHTPIITTNDCEGAGEMFRVTTLDAKNPPTTPDGEVDFTQDFFGRPTSLTVSGQLEAEAMAMAFGKVYTFGPTFRAER